MRELYYAIHAFNRLDLNAENSFSSICGPLLNGFFIRDDVNITSSNTYSKLNANSGYLMPPVNAFESDFIDPDPRNKEMSKDQVIWIFQALMFIRKYIPPGTIYYENGIPKYFHDGVFDIFYEASIISTRLISYMRSQNPSGWTWLIVNPVTGQSVKRGNDAYTLSYGFREAYKNISGNTISSNWLALPLFNAARTLWDYYENNPIPYSYDEDFKIEMLVAIGNSWPVYLSWNQILQFGLFPELKANYNYTKLENRCISQDNKALPDFHQVLNNPTTTNLLDADLRSWFNLAHCESFWNYGIGYGANFHSPFPYGVSSFIMHPRYNFPPQVNNPTFPGDFNGLDFMLMHNMRYLKHMNDYDNYPPFLDKFNTYVSTYIPIASLNGGLGTIFNPLTILSLGSIEADNTIGTGADVTYRASTYIELKPGFQTLDLMITYYFTAIVDPVECNSISGEIERITNENLAEETQNLSNPLPISESKESLLVYPNPSSSEFNIVLPYESDTDYLTIVDLTGRIITRSVTSVKYYKIIANELASGIYYVKFDKLITKIIKL